jgi:hypothetical protein
MAWKFNECS